MRCLFVSIGLFLATTACGNLPNHAFELTQESSIQLTDSRFTGMPAIFSREIFCGRQESVTWAGAPGLAELSLTSADEGCILYEPLEPEEELALKFKWLEEAGVRFEGSPIMIEAPLGTVWVRRFAREDRQCFFIRHAFEAHHFSIYSDPTTFLAGYFCGQPGQPNSTASIRKFVEGISLRDEPKRYNDGQMARLPI